MPDYRYTLDYERAYHDLGLVQPGEVRTLRKAPDQHWKPVQHKTGKPAKTEHHEDPAPADTTASEE